MTRWRPRRPPDENNGMTTTHQFWLQALQLNAITVEEFRTLVGLRSEPTADRWGSDDDDDDDGFLDNIFGVPEAEAV